jgi:hypothetical protein
MKGTSLAVLMTALFLDASGAQAQHRGGHGAYGHRRAALHSGWEDRRPRLYFAGRPGCGPSADHASVVDHRGRRCELHPRSKHGHLHHAAGRHLRPETRLHDCQRARRGGQVGRPFQCADVGWSSTLQRLRGQVTRTPRTCRSQCPGVETRRSRCDDARHILAIARR